MTPFNLPTHAPRQMDYLHAAFESGHLSGDGPFNARAEGILSNLHAGARVLLATSCTHALELAALLLDIRPGDEVAMPSFTFTSTANAFALRGARLRFADIDPGTFTMGPKELEAVLGKRTRAAVAMPYGGVPCGFGEMERLCRDRRIPLVVDNAHGLFASAGGRPLGTFGRMSALSFHSSKNISCGEGGALVLNDASLAARAEILREKGTDRSRFFRGEVDRYTWQDIGSSYLPSDALAAILVSQLEAGEEIQSRRLAVWRAYREVLERDGPARGLVLQEIPPGVSHPAHLFALLVPEDADRDDTLKRLSAAGVRALSHYEPLHLAPARLRCLPEGLRGPERLPVTERIAPRLLRLPLFAGLDPNLAASIAGTLLEILDAARRRPA